ncbi:MAG: hypothetical protein JNK90_30010 [Planctomycetaceae bacterium]|nr:hypothetical protein [Planctomycetaceae bacterium]
MSNISFSDLSVSHRRERITAVLAIGLQRVLDQRGRISANSRDLSLEDSSDLRLSVSQPEIGEPDDAGET